ncbi:multicopper oxidase-domain-containing protein [Collybia nuda]|uniref:laccase n=1 Tax=Collybia nuda TaxID=64659 RepID=A0A9P5XZJ6_9AGAR|nr:multicopper oxidase-domain-containing protein [Collybia nuda]
MAQGTSIHWHGILQPRTADQDGVAWVTQCPIAANNTFMYDFPLGDQTGTYWYHSHATTQYCDGLRGPFVIYDRAADPHKGLFHNPSPQAWRDFDTLSISTHHFEVVRSAGSNVTNTNNPPIPDGVNTGLIGDEVTIYFRTDNPGPWIFHCHIDFHLEAGLAVVFAEGIKSK